MPIEASLAAVRRTVAPATNLVSSETQTATASFLMINPMFHYEEVRDIYGSSSRSVATIATMSLVAATLITVVWLLLGMVLVGS